MNDLISRARVVATAAVTWLLVASAVVQIFADEVAAVLPVGTAEDVATIAVRAVAVIGAAVAIIRRVSEVVPSERGLLP